MSEAMGKLDRQGHQFFGLIASKAEHEALVAGTTGIDAHGDVGRLTLDGADHSAGVGVKTVFGVVIADLANRFASDFVVIDVRAGGNLARDDDQTGGDQRFASYAPPGILAHDFIENGVGDLVSDLVGMTFSNGLGSEQKIPLGLAQNNSPQ